MSEFVVRYSFNFRYTKDQHRSVDVPLEHLVGLNLNEYVIRDVIRTTPELHDALMGPQAQYVLDCEYWQDWKSLERRNEKIEIVRK